MSIATQILNEIDRLHVEYMEDVKKGVLEPDSLFSRDAVLFRLRDFVKAMDKSAPPKAEIIEIPFGANDSELLEAAYTIPDGFYAHIEDSRVVLKKKPDNALKTTLHQVVVSDGKDHSDWLGFFQGVWEKFVELDMVKLPYEGNGDQLQLVLW